MEIVPTLIYLGTIFDRKLRWDPNTQAVMEKAQQRLFLLRKLVFLSLPEISLAILQTPYGECAVLVYLFYNSLSVKDKNSWHHVEYICSKVAGTVQSDLQTVLQVDT